MHCARTCVCTRSRYQGRWRLPLVAASRAHLAVHCSSRDGILRPLRPPNERDGAGLERSNHCGRFVICFGMRRRKASICSHPPRTRASRRTVVGLLEPTPRPFGRNSSSRAPPRRAAARRALGLSTGGRRPPPPRGDRTLAGRGHRRRDDCGLAGHSRELARRPQRGKRKTRPKAGPRIYLRLGVEPKCASEILAVRIEFSSVVRLVVRNSFENWRSAKCRNQRRYEAHTTNVFPFLSRPTTILRLPPRALRPLAFCRRFERTTGVRVRQGATEGRRPTAATTEA
jgi:hypothetical protein